MKEVPLTYNLPKDAKVWVRNSPDEPWQPAHYAGLTTSGPCVWADGKTSFTTERHLTIMIPTKKQVYQEKQGLIERIIAQRNLTVRIIAELRNKLSCTITFADMPREDIEAVAAQFRDKGWTAYTRNCSKMINADDARKLTLITSPLGYHTLFLTPARFHNQ